MKIAVASTGKDLSAQVSSITGRAPYYLLFENKKLIKTIKNPFQYGGGGAGFGVAQMLANEKVELVIGGRFGPNVQSFFDSKGIKTKTILNKTVEQVIKEL